MPTATITKPRANQHVFKPYTRPWSNPKYRYYNCHVHLSFSNNRITDSINKLWPTCVAAKKKGMAGIALTGHGELSSHVLAAKLQDKHPDFFNGKDGHGTFKIVLGSEIYLVDKPIIDKARKHNLKTKFFHFIVTAKDDWGYHALRIISSNSWENLFWYRGLRRVPTYKDWLNQLMNDPKTHFKGHLQVSTACLGSELSQSILANDKPRAKKYIKYLEDTFGKDNIAYEMMPADNRHGQITVNKTLWNISHGLGYFDDDTGKGIPCVISTDAHYLDAHDRIAHTVYLKAHQPGRDVKNFYYFAHLYTYKELEHYFKPDILREATQNSMKILKRFAPLEHKSSPQSVKKDPKSIKLYIKQEIPTCPVPDVKPWSLKPWVNKYGIDFKDYPWIPRFINSKFKADRRYMDLCFKGMKKHHLPWNRIYLTRMNTELYTLHRLTQYFKMPISQYFLSVRYAVIDSIWEAGSLVGIGRGSSGAWLGSFLTGVNYVNPIKHKLYYWRFANPERIDDMPDIDIDSEASKRAAIIAVLRKKYGKNRILNFSVFTTEKPKSTVMDACRGLRINHKEAQNIASLIPVKENGVGNISIKDALYGNKKHGIKPATAFIKAVDKHKYLRTAILGIAGVISNISEHASGVAIFNEPSYTYRNAMMKTSQGIPVTQYSAHDSEYDSVMKMDILTLSMLDKAHEAMRLLERAHLIKKQPTLKQTFSKYFATEKLDMTSPEIYKILYSGKMIDAFEFSTLVGKDTLYTLKPNSLESLTAANALMRLTVDKGEQPAHRYKRYREHPNDWDKDMKKAGLTDAERKIMHSELDRFSGVCYSQEALMHVAMNKKIAGYNMLQANHLRKAIATKSPKLQAQQKHLLFTKGHKLGTSDNLLSYVWDQCAKPAENYSFNLAHGTAYSINLLIELNICKYGIVFWNTACLTINSGLFGKNLRNPNYDKLDRAMAELKGHIASPDINHSARGFTPYHNKILYGLYPISGINTKDVDTILNIRKKYGPFTSFTNFLHQTKFTDKANISLIKAGCFDSLCKSSDTLPARRQLLSQYLIIALPSRKRLTMRQVPKIVKHIPAKYRKLVELYAFRSELNSETKGESNKPVTNITGRTFIDEYAKAVAPYAKVGQMSLLGGGNSEKPYWYDKAGRVHINCSGFERYYQKAVDPLRDWLKTPEARNAEADNRRQKLVQKYAPGNPNAWEMQSLGCYIHAHELSKTLLAQQYGITADYAKVPKKPQVVYDFKVNDDRHPGKKREIKIFHHYFIYGTAISKNANKGLVYLLTPHGLANVYCGKWRYAIYNKRISKKMAARQGTLPKNSWFDRGTKLAILGYRSENNFFANKAGAKDIIYQKQHPKMKHSELKRYSECLYRIAGYGPAARLISIDNRKGVQNPLPTKNTHIDKYATSKQILKHNQQRAKKNAHLRHFLKQLVANSQAPDDNGRGHKGNQSYTRSDELKYLHDLSALLQACHRMK